MIGPTGGLRHHVPGFCWALREIWDNGAVTPRLAALILKQFVLEGAQVDIWIPEKGNNMGREWP